MLILRRIAGVIPVTLLILLFVFTLLRASPGDPAAIIAGESATPQQIAQIRASLGLDQSIPRQFIDFLGQLLHGDLGHSVFSNLPVTDLIAQRVGPTFALATATMIFATLLAIPLGTLAATRAGRVADRAIMIFAVLAFSFPVFWTGYALVILFSVDLRVLPVQGYSPLSDGIGAFAAHLALPTLTLGLTYMALLTRMTRSAMLEVLSQDYIRTARAKGLAGAQILFTHALKNAAIPIVTTIGLGIGILLGGTVVTESVFGIPGLGRLAVDAITTHDYPVIQGLILFFAGIYVALNLVIDITYTVLDPRIKP